MPRTKKKF